METYMLGSWCEWEVGRECDSLAGSSLTCTYKISYLDGQHLQLPIK